MAIVITKRGELPEKKTYSVACYHCQTEFTYQGEDVVTITSPKPNDDYHYVNCPLCNQQIAARNPRL